MEIAAFEGGVISRSTRIVIVGTGQAGYQAAASLRQVGYSGNINLIGDEPGLPYQRPPLSKAFLKPGAKLDDLSYRPDSFYEKYAIGLIRGRRVEAIDRTAQRVILDDGTNEPYDRLILATGARNRQLDALSGSAPGAFYLRNVEDAGRLKVALASASNVLVVGGGFLGLEVSAAARSGGAEVTLLEAGPRLMGRVVSEEVSEHVLHRHTKAGVEFRLETGLAELLYREGKLYAGITTKGERIHADLVFIAVGVIPNIRLAQECGLSVENGVSVDKYLRTSDPAIYAIGDCALFPSPFAEGAIRLESVQNAADQGRCVAANICGKSTPYCAIPWFWSDQGNVRLQIVGIGRPGDIVMRTGGQDTLSFYRFNKDRLVSVESINVPADHARAKRLLAGKTPVTPRDLQAALCSDGPNRLL